MKYVMIALAFAAFLISSKLFCDDKGKAKEHFLKGKTLVEEGAYDKAIVELEASYELNPVPIVLFNIALCYDELHKYADAMKHYRHFLVYGKKAPKEMKEKVSERIKAISELIGLLKLEVDVEGAEIIIDNKLIGQTPTEVIFIETGEHDLSLRKTGFPDIKKKFKIVSGETTELSFAMKESKGKAIEEDKKAEEEEKIEAPIEEKKEEVKVSEPPSSEIRKEKKRKKLGTAPFWAVTAVALASLAGAAITGGLALDANSDFNNQYYEDSESWEPLQDRTNNLALTTDVLIGVGAASAVTAMVLIFFTDFKRKGEKNVAVRTLSPICFSGSTLEWRF